MLIRKMKIPSSWNPAEITNLGNARNIYSDANAENSFSPASASIPKLISSNAQRHKGPVCSTTSLKVKIFCSSVIGFLYCVFLWWSQFTPGPRGCLMFSLTCAVNKRLNLAVLHWGWNWEKWRRWHRTQGDFVRRLVTIKAALISIFIETMDEMTMCLLAVTNPRRITTSLSISISFMERF